MHAKFNQEDYNKHFAGVSQDIRAGPVPNQKRSCNDICCFVTFVLIVLTTLVIGAIMINDGRKYFSNVFDSSSQTNISGISVAFSTQGGIIVGMFFLSLALAVGFIFLVKKFPKCMIYSMIVAFYLILVALIVLGIINGIWWLVITFGVMLLITSCILFCFRDRIVTGIILLRVSASFISDKPSVYLAPLYPLVFAIIFFVYWIAALVSQTYNLYVLNQLSKTNPNISTSKQTGFIVAWIVIFIFMMQFFSYVLTYFISTCCSYWYYGFEVNYCFKAAVTLNRFHIGSLTFGALIVTVVTILKNLAREGQRQSKNIAATICFCLLRCCLECIGDIIKVLNHNSVIVMAVTGQSYINSAKTALSLIFSEFGLFQIVSFIGNIVTFFGVLLSVGVPTLVGFLIIRYARKADQFVSSYSAVAIFFLSLMIAGHAVKMITQALSCVFIYFCFDKKFRSMGIVVPNSPPAIRQFLDYGHIAGAPARGTEQQLGEGRYF